jgi:hypothetical protein
MERDFGSRLTVHINRHSFDNFALGLDCYRVWDYETEISRARVVQLNYLFFNITLTFWKAGLR